MMTSRSAKAPDCDIHYVNYASQLLGKFIHLKLLILRPDRRNFFGIRLTPQLEPLDEEPPDFKKIV